MDRLKREGNPPVGQLASPIPQYKDVLLDGWAELQGEGGASYVKDRDALVKLEQVKSELELVKAELATIKANQLSGDQKVQLSGNIMAQDIINKNSQPLSVVQNPDGDWVLLTTEAAPPPRLYTKSDLIPNNTRIQPGESLIVDEFFWNEVEFSEVWYNFVTSASPQHLELLWYGHLGISTASSTRTQLLVDSQIARENLPGVILGHVSESKGGALSYSTVELPPGSERQVFEIKNCRDIEIIINRVIRFGRRL